MVVVIVFKSSINTDSEYGKAAIFIPLIFTEVVVPGGRTSYTIVGFSYK